VTVSPTTTGIVDEKGLSSYGITGAGTSSVAYLERG
jgi:hypothetical protein